MIKKLSKFLASKKEGSLLFVDSDIFDEVDVKDLVVEDGMSFRSFKKTRTSPILNILVDTKELYRRAQQEDLLYRMIRIEGSYYGLSNIDQAFNELHNSEISGAFFINVPVRGLREFECMNGESRLFHSVQAPLFTELESLYRKTNKTLEVLTTSGARFTTCRLNYLAVKYFDCIRSGSTDLFNRLVYLVNSFRGYGSIRSIYFTEPLEMSYSHLDYNGAIFERSTVEARITSSHFDSIHLADDGIYLRDVSENLGQSFLLFIPYSLFKKVKVADDYDEYSGEAEYIDYGYDDGSDEFDDGSHCAY